MTTPGGLASLDEQSTAELQTLVTGALDSQRVNETYHYTNKIVRLMGRAADLPRVVILGLQSAGKTTLLDALLGAPIGFVAHGLGTKCPVEILMSPSDDNRVHINFNGEALIEPRINTQLHGSTGADLSGENRSTTNYQLFDELNRRMAKYMDNISSNEVNFKELKIEISMPDAPNILVVDLPGIIISTGEAKTRTLEISRSYIEKYPDNIYIFVTKSGDDTANMPHEVIDLLNMRNATGEPILKPEQKLTVCTRAKGLFEDHSKTSRNLKDVQKWILDKIPRPRIGQGDSLVIDKFDDDQWPIFTLELFSLDDSTRKAPFESRQATMKEEQKGGEAAVIRILNNNYPVRTAIDQKILDDLKFHSTFRNFRIFVEERLTEVLKRSTESNKESYILEKDDYREKLDIVEAKRRKQGVRSVANDIREFAKNINSRVHEIFNGDILPDKLFTQKYAKTLSGDLEDGHKLALERNSSVRSQSVEYYSEDNHYKFLKAYRDEAALARALPNREKWVRRQLEYIDIGPLSDLKGYYHDLKAKIPRASPGVLDREKSGQLIRRKSSKDVYKIGYLMAVMTFYTSVHKKDPPLGEKGADGGNNEVSSPGLDSTQNDVRSERERKKAECGFAISGLESRVSQTENAIHYLSQHDSLGLKSRNDCEFIIPLGFLPNINTGTKGLLGWRFVKQPPEYFLVPTLIKKIVGRPTRVANPWAHGSVPYDMPSEVLAGEAVVRDIIYQDPASYKKPTLLEERDIFNNDQVKLGQTIDMCVPIEDLFIDFLPEDYEAIVTGENYYTDHIKYASQNQLNHQCLKRLSVWLEQMINVIPTIETVDAAIGQQSGAYSGCQDISDDSVSIHTNMRNLARAHMFPLATLAVYTAGAVLRRIILASLEMVIDNLPEECAYLKESRMFEKDVQCYIRKYVLEIVDLCRKHMFIAVADSWSTIVAKGPLAAVQKSLSFCTSLSDDHRASTVAVKSTSSPMVESSACQSPVKSDQSKLGTTGLSTFMKSATFENDLTMLSTLATRELEDRQKNTFGGDIDPGRAFFRLCEPHVWLAKLNSSRILQSKLYHCFSQTGKECMPTLELFNESDRPPIFSSYLTNKLLHPPELKDESELSENELLGGYYRLAGEIDYNSQIIEIKQKISGIDNLIRVDEHLGRQLVDQHFTFFTLS